MENLASLVESLLIARGVSYRKVRPIGATHVRVSLGGQKSLLISRENGVVICRDQNGRMFEFTKKKINFQDDKDAVIATNVILAPTTGRLKEMFVIANQKFKRGDTLCIIESMKMETQVRAPFDLEIVSAGCLAGSSVVQGQLIAQVQVLTLI